jgi:hypothetical protein
VKDERAPKKVDPVAEFTWMLHLISSHVDEKQV